MGDMDHDEEIAADNWDDEGGHLATLRRNGEWDSWNQTAGDHWHGYAPPTTTRAIRDEDSARDGRPGADATALEHWDDDGGTEPIARPATAGSRSRSPHRIAHFPPL